MRDIASSSTSKDLYHRIPDSSDSSGKPDDGLQPDAAGPSAPPTDLEGGRPEARRAHGLSSASSTSARSTRGGSTARAGQGTVATPSNSLATPTTTFAAPTTTLAAPSTTAPPNEPLDTLLRGAGVEPALSSLLAPAVRSVAVGGGVGKAARAVALHLLRHSGQENAALAASLEDDAAGSGPHAAGRAGDGAAAAHGEEEEEEEETEEEEGRLSFGGKLLFWEQHLSCIRELYLRGVAAPSREGPDTPTRSAFRRSAHPQCPLPPRRVYL